MYSNEKRKPAGVQDPERTPVDPEKLHSLSSPPALRQQTPVDAVFFDKLQPHFVFFLRTTLCEVLLEELSLKEALLTQIHNSLQASMDAMFLSVARCV
ncbi:hypothetical protein NQZ68_007650 [Dissostichus eleginoides]|nr:hypothetical protein NQZ68_007650 [Dissostichus eleginoides]